MSKTTLVNLKPIDNIFTKTESLSIGVVNSEDKIAILDINSLCPYSKHSFKPYIGYKLDSMLGSIKEYGVITPVVVRSLENNQYEIISGHQRTHISKLAGLTEIPAVIRNYDNDTADILMVQSNRDQRSEYSISEKAKSFKILYDAMQRRGKRTDMQTDENKGKSTAQIIADGENEKISERTIMRFLKISELSDELLEYVDNGVISFNVASILGFLDKEVSQKELLSYIQENEDLKMNDKIANLLKDAMLLTREKITKLLSKSETKAKKKAKSEEIKISNKKLDPYFGTVNLTEKQKVETILKALELYYKRNAEN